MFLERRGARLECTLGGLCGQATKTKPCAARHPLLHQQLNGFNNTTPNSYEAGSCLMAMSLYLVTGGPDDVGANKVAGGSKRRKRSTARRVQRDESGGWLLGLNQVKTYRRRSSRWPVFQRRSVPNADSVLPNSVGFIRNTQRGDGGHSYRSGGGTSTSTMSASGLWTHRLAGLPTGDARVQESMRWMRDNYSYNSIIQINGWAGQYYYLWAAAKVSRSHDDGAGAFCFLMQLVASAISCDGHPEESTRWYYDFAWWLIRNQSGNGSWSNPRSWDGMAATAFAILVLQRSSAVCASRTRTRMAFVTLRTIVRMSPTRIKSIKTVMVSATFDIAPIYPMQTNSMKMVMALAMNRSIRLHA